MRKAILIILTMLSCAAFAAQDTVHLYKDTLDARTLTLSATDDDLLLSLVARQSEHLAAAADSAEKARLQTDLTTVVPLHLGYADSLRIRETVKRQGGMSSICLPQLYMPVEAPHLRPLTYDIAPAESSLPQYGLSPSLGDPKAAARKHLTTRAATLYVGTYSPDKVERPVDPERTSLYELSVAGKSIVRDDVEERKELVNRLKNKNNPWFKEASVLLQITQNYVSGNWYEGGNSAFAMYSSLKGTIKYDDKKRLTWENTAEWNAGVTTQIGDTCHKVNCSDDLLRLYSKLGVKIVPKLYGSFSVELRTQLFPTYKSNSKTALKTGFMTPLRFNMALGFDYKPVSGLSMVFSPLAFKMVYANDTLNAPYKTFGIPAGTNLLADVGSSVRIEWQWKPVREVALETKFYAYTNYKMVELDLEVNCDFIINRFFSARVMLHPRYDSTRIMEGEEKAKIQFKELISVGFAHKFH